MSMAGAAAWMSEPTGAAAKKADTTESAEFGLLGRGEERPDRRLRLAIQIEDFPLICADRCAGGIYGGGVIRFDGSDQCGLLRVERALNGAHRSLGSGQNACDLSRLRSRKVKQGSQTGHVVGDYRRRIGWC